jgi:hypothetical protein
VILFISYCFPSYFSIIFMSVIFILSTRLFMFLFKIYFINVFIWILQTSVSHHYEKVTSVDIQFYNPASVFDFRYSSNLLSSLTLPFVIDVSAVNISMGRHLQFCCWTRRLHRLLLCDKHLRVHKAFYQASPTLGGFLWHGMLSSAWIFHRVDGPEKNDII